MKENILAVDLDGTLLGPDGFVSPRTLKAVYELRDAGWKLVIATGRPARWIAPVAMQLGWNGLAVAANGAVILNLNSRIIDRVFPMPTGAALNCIDRIRDLCPEAAFGVEYAEEGAAIPHGPGGVARQWDRHEQLSGDFGFESGFRPWFDVPSRTRIAPADQLIRNGNVVKLVAQVLPARNHDDLVAEVSLALNGIATVTVSSGDQLLIEMSRHGVSKASGVKLVAAAHGKSSRHVVAVGDMPNDLAMLLWASRGFAMGNAHHSVHALVGPERILPTNADHGVAVLIDELLTGISPRPQTVSTDGVLVRNLDA